MGTGQLLALPRLSLGHTEMGTGQLLALPRLSLGSSTTIDLALLTFPLNKNCKAVDRI